MKIIHVALPSILFVLKIIIKSSMTQTWLHSTGENGKLPLAGAISRQQMEAVVDVEWQAAVVESSHGGVLHLADRGNRVSNDVSGSLNNIVLGQIVKNFFRHNCLLCELWICLLTPNE